MWTTPDISTHEAYIALIFSFHFARVIFAFPHATLFCVCLHCKSLMVWNPVFMLAYLGGSLLVWNVHLMFRHMQYLCRNLLQVLQLCWIWCRFQIHDHTCLKRSFLDCHWGDWVSSWCLWLQYLYSNKFLLSTPFTFVLVHFMCRILSYHHF